MNRATSPLSEAMGSLARRLRAKHLDCRVWLRDDGILQALDDASTGDATSLPCLSMSLSLELKESFGLAGEAWSMPLLSHGRELGVMLIGGTGIEAAMPLISTLVEHSLELVTAVHSNQAETELFASISRRTNYAVLITDAEGRIESANEAFTQLSGYRLEEVKGRKPGEFLQGASTDHGAIARMRAHHLAGRGFHEILCNYRKNGQAYWVDIEVEPIFDGSGKLTHYMSIERDVSAQVATLENLRRAHEDAETSTKYKANFLLTLSQELRTPLNSVIGYAELMLSEAGLAASHLEQLGYIRNSGLQLLDIIQEVTEFSSLENSLLKVEKKSFEPLAELDVLREQILPRLLPAQDLVFDISPDFESRALGDPDRIRDVLRHLLVNAVNFTPKGTITLRAWRLEENLFFEVSDSGAGMDEATLANLFKPFTRSGENSALRFGGAGVGLCIVDKLLKLMKGGITVKSRLGEGSCFSLHLEAPLHCGDIAPQAEQGDWSGRRFLAVDDNLVNLQLLRRLLERGAAEVLLARDGEEALELALKEQPDLILMDLEMPVLNGIDATRRLRQAGYTRPIIALTAHTDDSLRVEALVAGMDDYLFKPVRSFLDLSKTIDRHLELKQTADGGQ